MLIFLYFCVIKIVLKYLMLTFTGYYACGKVLNRNNPF